MHDRVNVRPSGPYDGVHGPICREKLLALVELRSAVLRFLRGHLEKLGALEVTTATLVNVAGSCENPYASFPLEFYGGEAYLSQSAQLQLEPLVIRLERAFFTFASSFRAEDYDDPESVGRRLSEFSLVEFERPFPEGNPRRAAADLSLFIEQIVRVLVESVVKTVPGQLRQLGGSPERLIEMVADRFATIEWSEAAAILHSGSASPLHPEDLTISHERFLLRRFGNRPLFVVGHPPALKFFNAKRDTTDDRCFSVDLLLPPLGETVGGGLREEDSTKLESQLRSSEVAQFIVERNGSPEDVFARYLEITRTEKPLLRGGFGIGFERLIAFLINSTDIVHSIEYREVAALNR